MTVPADVDLLYSEAVYRFETVYRAHLNLLIGIAVSQFHIAESDGQALAHEIFIAYFLKAEDISDTRAWLIGAIHNACKHFLRARARGSELPPEADPLLRQYGTQFDEVRNSIAVAEALSCITARCQLALRLRYIEGYTIPEIAAQLRTTPKYAQNLICRCLRQARERYQEKGKS